jgi:hypothetical protein
MNSFVINGLVKRRAELAGDIEKTHETLRKMVLDLESLDATASEPLTNARFCATAYLGRLTTKATMVIASSANQSHCCWKNCLQ